MQSHPDGSQPVKTGTSDQQPPSTAELRPIGVVRSSIVARHDAPKQGFEGAPDAWLEVFPWAAEGLMGISPGDRLIVITWLHLGARDVFQVRPRRDPRNALTGVFATRSPDRPNPLGLHPVVVRRVEGTRLRVGPLEVMDGTPVVDIKPVLEEPAGLCSPGGLSTPGPEDGPR